MERDSDAGEEDGSNEEEQCDGQSRRRGSETEETTAQLQRQRISGVSHRSRGKKKKKQLSTLEGFKKQQHREDSTKAGKSAWGILLSTSSRRSNRSFSQIQCSRDRSEIEMNLMEEGRQLSRHILLLRKLL